MTTTAHQPLLSVHNLKTYFPIRRGIVARTVGHVKAVDDVCLTIGKGETVGLVGESGCGKTTLGRTLVRLQPATAGKILFEGEDLLQLRPRQFQTLRQRLQMIFQDPYACLNPRMTVRDLITEAPAVHGRIRHSERDELAATLLGDVGLDLDALHRYPHEFSGGQRQRISIARALALNPDFVVCDEAVSALDVSVQAQVINLLLDLRAKYQLSYLFISHDLSVVKLIANRIAVMYLGQIIEHGSNSDVIEAPQHPYTQALVSAIPVPGQARKQRILLHGDLPSPANPPSGCRFHTRCAHATDICRQQVPDLRQIGQQYVSCHLAPISPRCEATPAAIRPEDGSTGR